MRRRYQALTSWNQFNPDPTFMALSTIPIMHVETFLTYLLFIHVNITATLRPGSQPRFMIPYSKIFFKMVKRNVFNTRNLNYFYLTKPCNDWWTDVLTIMNLRHERKFKSICAHSFRGTCARRSGLQVGDDVSNRKGRFCGLDWEYTLGRQIPPSGTWRMHVRTLSSEFRSNGRHRERFEEFCRTPPPLRPLLYRKLASSYYACLRKCSPNVMLSSFKTESH